MPKKLYGLIIKGYDHRWSFDVYIDPRYIEEWREDGIDIEEIVNTIPVWIVDLGLIRPWCFVQDCFYFKNSFRK